MKNKISLLQTLLIIAVLLSVWCFQPSKLEVCQISLAKVKFTTYNGLVVEKYIDVNHAIPTIVVKSGDETFKIFDFRDESGYYEYVLVGDSVNKKSNSLEVNIKRSENIRKFIIDYDCDFFQKKK